MARTLTLLFRREPSRDRTRGSIRFEGYRLFWPDGAPVTLALDVLCLHGQRLLGLGRHLGGRAECLLEVVCFPLPGPEADPTKRAAFERELEELGR